MSEMGIKNDLSKSAPNSVIPEFLAPVIVLYHSPETAAASRARDRFPEPSGPTKSI
jgi:hypothetical protein